MEDDARGAALARVLRAATDAHGRGPLPWLAAPVEDAATVLDLACGDGPIADVLGPSWIGIDDGPGARPRLRADLHALPVLRRCVDAVALVGILHLLPSIDALFAEIRRVLRPGGTVVALVPSHSVRSRSGLALARLLAPVRRGAWPHRSALEHAAWLMVAADFAVLGDDRVEFALPLPDPDAAARAVDDLVRSGLWPPGLPAEVREHLARELGARSGHDRVLPVPLRRVIARR